MDMDMKKKRVIINSKFLAMPEFLEKRLSRNVNTVNKKAKKTLVLKGLRFFTFTIQLITSRKSSALLPLKDSKKIRDKFPGNYRGIYPKAHY
jgi:hypothetical protein